MWLKKIARKKTATYDFEMKSILFSAFLLCSSALAETDSLEALLGVCPDDGSPAPEGCTVAIRGGGHLINKFELKTGDIITEVNGEAVSDPAEAFKKLNGHN